MLQDQKAHAPVCIHLQCRKCCYCGISREVDGMGHSWIENFWYPIVRFVCACHDLRPANNKLLQDSIFLWYVFSVGVFPLIEKNRPLVRTYPSWKGKEPSHITSYLLRAHLQITSSSRNSNVHAYSLVQSVKVVKFVLQKMSEIINDFVHCKSYIVVRQFHLG